MRNLLGFVEQRKKMGAEQMSHICKNYIITTEQTAHTEHVGILSFTHHHHTVL